MKRVASVAVAALTCTGLLAACGSDPECVSIPSAVVEAIESGARSSVTFGSYGGVETTIADRDAYVVAIELDRTDDIPGVSGERGTGVWRAAVSNTGGTILAANSDANIFAEWPRDRDEDEHLVVVPPESWRVSYAASGSVTAVVS